jgi:hypothetical protein
MQIGLFLVALLWVENSVGAESKSATGSRHTAVGFHHGTVKDMRTDNVIGFDRITGGFVSTETSNTKTPKMVMKGEVAVMQAADGVATWAGIPNTVLEIEDWQGNLNLMVYLFSGAISPWISPGVSFGSLKVKHSQGEETKFHQGWNAEAGVDLMFGALGLRAGYAYQNVYSDRFGKLDDRRLIYNFDRFFAALVFESF